MVTLLSILCPPCVPVDKLINLLRNIFTVSFALSALVLRWGEVIRVQAGVIAASLCCWPRPPTLPRHNGSASVPAISSSCCPCYPLSIIRRSKNCVQRQKQQRSTGDARTAAPSHTFHTDADIVAETEKLKFSHPSLKFRIGCDEDVTFLATKYKTWTRRVHLVRGSDYMDSI